MTERSEDERRPESAVEADPGSAAVEAEVEVLDGESDAPDPGSPGEVEQPAVEPSADAEEQPSETELQAAIRERDEYLELAQRTRAELENYRRRVSAEAQAAEQRGRAAVARGVLGGLDNLERALLAAGVDPQGLADDGEPRSEEVSAQTALAQGVALVYRDLREGLLRAGVEAFDPSGEKFDPATSEAVATGDGGEGIDPGIVIEVLEKGYRIGEQTLRPARVVVSG